MATRNINFSNPSSISLIALDVFQCYASDVATSLVAALRHPRGANRHGASRDATRDRPSARCKRPPARPPRRERKRPIWGSTFPAQRKALRAIDRAESRGIGTGANPRRLLDEYENEKKPGPARLGPARSGSARELARAGRVFGTF